MSAIQTFKNLLNEQIEYQLKQNWQNTLAMDDLQSIHDDLKDVETLSDLYHFLDGHAITLSTKLSDGWITTLSNLIDPATLNAHRILINPSQIPDTEQPMSYVALYDRYTQTVQSMNEVTYIGHCSLKITGGLAHTVQAREVQASGEAVLYACYQGHVHASGHASVTLHGDCTCTADDQAEVTALSKNLVIARGENRVALYYQAWGLSLSGNQQWEVHPDTCLYLSPQHQSTDQIQVELYGPATLFNGTQANVTSKDHSYLKNQGTIIDCHDQPHVCAALEKVFNERKPDKNCHWVEEPLPITQSRNLLRPVLPPTATPEELARFNQAVNEQELCQTLVDMMTQYPEHVIPRDVLSTAITSETLLANGIHVSEYSRIQDETGHVFLYGNRIVNTDLGEQSHVYHLYGTTLMLYQSDESVHAKDHACLIQCNGGRKSQLTAHGDSTLIALTHQYTNPIQVDGNATAICCENTHIIAKGDSRVIGSDSVTMELYDRSQGATIGSQVEVQVHSAEAQVVPLKDASAAQQYIARKEGGSQAHETTRNERNGYHR